MPDYGLKGRVAIVTGGSKGIGNAIAATLAREGCDLAICARNEAELDTAAAGLREIGGRRCLAVPADVTAPEQIARVVDETARAFGRIDILVNNATSSFQGRFLELPDEAWHYHLEAKLMGYVRFARRAIPHMQQRGWGRIVNIAGVAARAVAPLRYTNGVTNAAVANIAGNLGRELVGQGIAVNTVHPGFVWTPRLEQLLHRESELQGISMEEAGRRLLASVPLGRFVAPQEVANVVAFLCSDMAAPIAGQSIGVDGGCHEGINY